MGLNLVPFSWLRASSTPSWEHLLTAWISVARITMEMFECVCLSNCIHMRMESELQISFSNTSKNNGNRCGRYYLHYPCPQTQTLSISSLLRYKVPTCITHPLSLPFDSPLKSQNKTTEMEHQRFKKKFCFQSTVLHHVNISLCQSLFTVVR